MKHFFSSTQWTFFILANIVVIPVSIGFAFGLSQTEIAYLLQRTFFVVGFTSLLQGFFGHKLPLNESPAGLWWSVFLIYAGFAATGAKSADIVLRSLEMGILMSGILFLLLSTFKLMDQIKKLFTPLVTGTYLILLVTQLSGPFMKGIFGIGYLSKGFDGAVAVCAIITLIFSVVLAKSRFKLLSSYSVLISLAFGWILFAIVGITKPLSLQVNEWISFAKPFEWGTPVFDIGIMLTSLFTSFLLLTNLVASADVVAKVTERKEKVNYNRAGFVMGINHIISSCFSTVGAVPIAGVAGFISTTKIKEKLPFLIGSTVIMVMSFFPIIMAFFASIPVPVGYATLFLSISSLIGIGLREYTHIFKKEHAVSIACLSLMAGFGTMFLPAEALAGLPDGLTSILNNGLIIGIFICILLEQILREKQVSPSLEKSS
ncbi:purine/pyrimidine permease [Metabacillus fastidiosus]|uniref:Purine/pyrimidine permease n=1 Tax=Metabacillus fastidiosus TaxID=1458 RepID=A0ABU6NS12_9BACI|nr:purine/pyrimidine permease [Metabacillus fastidiosus]